VRNFYVRLIRILLIALVLVGLILLGIKLINLIIYILISLVLSLILMPAVNFLCGLKISRFTIPRGVASIFSIFAFFGLLGFALSLFVPSIAREVEFLSDIRQEQVQENIDFLLGKGENIISNYEKIAGLKQGEAIEKIKDYASEKFFDVLNFQGVSSFFNGLISTIGSALIGLFAVIFITFYFLKEDKLVANFIKQATPQPILPSVQAILTKTRNLLSRYFIGILIEMIFMASIVSLGLFVLGVRNPVLIGVFVGVINVIPYLGPSIGAVFGVILTIATGIHDPNLVSFVPPILKVLGTVAVAQIIDNTILQPQIYSKSVSAHPLEIFLVIIAAGTLYGISGMILAVPSYTVIRIVANEVISGYKSIYG
jgi:predicted PurR-regulated permease PerM